MGVCVFTRPLWLRSQDRLYGVFCSVGACKNLADSVRVPNAAALRGNKFPVEMGGNVAQR